jgi:hypothetical protein
MRRTELLLAGVAVALVGFVALSALRQRREPPPPAPRSTADAGAPAPEAAAAAVVSARPSAKRTGRMREAPGSGR